MIEHEVKCMIKNRITILCALIFILLNGISKLLNKTLMFYSKPLAWCKYFSATQTYKKRWFCSAYI